MSTTVTEAAAGSAGRSWLERVWSSIADRGRPYARVPAASEAPLQRAKQLTQSLLSSRGEASGAAVARELHAALAELEPEDRLRYYAFLTDEFRADEPRLREAAQAYLEDPSPERATALADAAEPRRQEVLRRMNATPGGTAALVGMRRDLLGRLRERPELSPLDSDLRHLLASWFNRGFLELRRIDWQTPAAVLEKLIRYEAVHEIQGWDDLRRRLMADRRCFAFFHPALPGEPLIFVEVALVQGLAASVQALLARDDDEQSQRQRARSADTAIFYSISNCQEGLRGISFGNFLIKQVVEELKAELPGLRQFSTLSPIPGFRRWLAGQGQSDDPTVQKLLAAMAEDLPHSDAEPPPESVRAPLVALCALFLTTPVGRRGPADPVARFHLGNGARLERINWLGNIAPRGLAESYGLMVNYLYDPDKIEANHEEYVRGTVVRSSAVASIVTGAASAGRAKQALAKTS